MSNYVMAFRGQPGRRPSEGEEREWGEWLGQISGSISDAGNRVGQVRSLPSGAPGNETVLSGYVVITADDLDAATELAKGCPGLKHGGGVEVGEVLAQ